VLQKNGQSLCKPIQQTLKATLSTFLEHDPKGDFHVKIKFLFLLLLILSAVTVLATSNGRSTTPHSQSEKQQAIKENDEEPIVSYDDEVNLSDITPPSVRTVKNKRYNNSIFAIEEEDIESLPLNSHWWNGLPALPINQSATVVIGTVKTSKAFLSDDKTGIYSEYSFQIEIVLKSINSIHYAGANTVIGERIGGAVQFKSGRVQRYRVSQQGIPKIGHRYVLFLKDNPEQQDYSIITGYELRNGLVILLDGKNSNIQFKQYEGMDEGSFLVAIGDAIAKQGP
jgi:hypothetical protein